MPDRAALLTRRAAADYCALSVRAFDQHVRPHLTVQRFGAAVRFMRKGFV